jgi:regulator of ribonuclease activity A
MTPKTSDLCDACDAALPCALPFRGWGQRRACAGTIRTLRVHEDIALMRDMVGQPGHGQVLVIDGGGSMARAIDVIAATAAYAASAGRQQ